MSAESNINEESSRRAAPGWVVVTSQELSAVWWRGKIPALLIPFSIALSFMSYLLVVSRELSLLTPEEMVLLVVQITIAVGLLISLIICATAISGERESGTLEGLLVTPVSRRQIILGKFLAALSPWPVILVISAAYTAILAPNAHMFWLSLLLSSLLGTPLVIISAGLGLLVSIYSNSNRSSLAVSLMVFLLFLVETQLPGGAQTGDVGVLFKRINPVESTLTVMEKVLVNNRTLAEMNNPAGAEGFWLLSPLLLMVLILVLLFAFSHSRLGLQVRLDLENKLSKLIPLRRSRGSHLVGLIAMFVLAGSLFAPRALALESAAKTSAMSEPLRISADRRYEVARTGGRFDFQTQIENKDPRQQSGPLVAAMNIINLGSGQPVDPEDWSPERTQTIDSLKPGQTSELTWTIEPILKGDYLIYLVVTPKPAATTSTTQPVASSGIHLTVQPYAFLNPAGILPLAVGMPTGLTAVWLGLRALRRREIEWTSPAP